MTPAEVVAFWRDAGRGRWFRGGVAFDEEVRRRLGAAHREAAGGGLLAWSDTAEGALALLILLDQVPRNVHRGTAAAFAGDLRALAAADAALGRGFDLQAALALQPFFYLPFGHAETPASQARSVALFAAHVERGGEVGYLAAARRRAEQIERFGRFPQRNAALDRASTPEEIAWLDARRAP